MNEEFDITVRAVLDAWGYTVTFDPAVGMVITEKKDA